jgi:hypothetical protein
LPDSLTAGSGYFLTSLSGAASLTGNCPLFCHILSRNSGKKIIAVVICLVFLFINYLGIKESVIPIVLIPTTLEKHVEIPMKRVTINAIIDIG